LRNRNTRWPDKVYRRFSVDIHIPDWHPDLLKHFDPEKYVANIARGGAQSLLHYTKSHVGLCLWKTKLDHTHNAMKNRDWFGEVVAACRRHGVHPLAYFSVIYDNWVFENHPDWRFSPADGPDSILNTRYGLVCPNTGYRDYVLACVREIASTYDIDGMFFDMTFWPGRPCYCPACTARFRKEHSADIPKVADWRNPVWRAFQHAREMWLREFAMACTAAAKAARPGMTVNHQYSTIFHPWTLGVPLEMRDACDYVGGDFYGGPLQHSLACKVYDSVTPNHPFEFHTSRTRNACDHVTVKPLDEIRVESHVATLHSAALMLVDYINADGTLNPEVHNFLGKLSRERAAYEPFLGGTMVADVAIYFDKNSLYDPRKNGEAVEKFNWGDAGPHLEALTGFARILQEAHIPFGIVTNVTLDQLPRYRAVVMPNVLELTKEQADAFRRFVKAGGSLYVSGSPAGLEDVLGIERASPVGTAMTYLTPNRGDPLVGAIWPQDHVSHAGPMWKTKPVRGAVVPARITLPFVEPESGKAVGSRFAAIHSNPPAFAATSSPAVVLHRSGRGRTAWAAAPFESRAEQVNTDLVLNLFRRLVKPPFAFEVDAHPAVEATLFDQPARGRLLLGLLNLQAKYPQAPVAAEVRVRVPRGRRIRSVRTVPGRRKVPFKVTGGYARFRVEPFTALRMFTLEFVAGRKR